MKAGGRSRAKSGDESNNLIDEEIKTEKSRSAIEEPPKAMEDASDRDNHCEERALPQSQIMHQ